MQLTFVIPDVNAFESGGNIYNKNLIDGLRQLGHAVKVLDLVAFKRIAFNALRGWYFFDTLYFSQLADIFAIKNKVCRFGLIVHHLESLYPPKGWTTKAYFQEIEWPNLKQFDSFLTSSQFTADYLSSHDLAQLKIVIPPALAYQPITFSKSKTDTINALIVANLVERKGILSFLKHLSNSNLKKEKTNLQIHLIGSSAIEKEYAKQCLSLIAKDDWLSQVITYTGQLSPNELHFYYQQANLFISTSFMETYGMALQEARSFRLPILAINGGNVKNHVENGQNGFIVKDMSTLVRMIKTIDQSPTLLKKLQDHTYRDTQNSFYNWQKAAKAFIKKIGGK